MPLMLKIGQILISSSLLKYLFYCLAYIPSVVLTLPSWFFVALMSHACISSLWIYISWVATFYLNRVDDITKIVCLHNISSIGLYIHFGTKKMNSIIKYYFTVIYCFLTLTFGKSVIAHLRLNYLEITFSHSVVIQVTKSIISIHTIRIYLGKIKAKCLNQNHFSSPI